MSCPVLYCTVLYCTVLYCTVLYCTVLYCTVLYCTALHCTALHCTALHCTALYCTVLYCTVLYCTVLYCTVLYCTVLYCTVLYCTVLYCTVLYPMHAIETTTSQKARNPLYILRYATGSIPQKNPGVPRGLQMVHAERLSSTYLYFFKFFFIKILYFQEAISSCWTFFHWLYLLFKH